MAKWVRALARRNDTEVSHQFGPCEIRLRWLPLRSYIYLGRFYSNPLIVVYLLPSPWSKLYVQTSKRKVLRMENATFILNDNIFVICSTQIIDRRKSSLSDLVSIPEKKCVQSI